MKNQYEGGIPGGEFAKQKEQMDLNFNEKKAQKPINFLSPPYTSQKRIELAARVIEKLRTAQVLSDEENQFNEWSISTRTGKLYD